MLKKCSTAVVLVKPKMKRISQSIKSLMTLLSYNTHLKEQCESFHESLKVVDVIEAGSDLDKSEERHPEDGEDEHDQKEE